MNESIVEKFNGQSEKLLELAKGEVLYFDISRTWLDNFAEQVKEYPDKLAVEDKSGSFTYGELDEASNKIANYLINNGVEENDFVAIMIDRVKEYVAAFTGIHKAGAAFVPVDLGYPAERIEYILTNSQAKIVLTEDEIKKIIAEDTEVQSINRTKPENRAYMIYTSGSTGLPKGVVLHQRGLMNFTEGIKSMFQLTCDDRISSHRSFSFDAHIGDFYPTLSAGASVHIMPEEVRKDLDQIYSFLNKNKITGGGYTTSIAKLLLDNYDLKQRFISCGGEALRGVKSDTVQIFNLYGPTECTNDIVVGKLEKGIYYESAPVGRPMVNGYCFIVDEDGKLVPQGVKGEICYAGPQVGYGYWNLDDKTKEVFVPCPFVDGLSMYHTGDLGYYDENGDIQYVGRIDFQVKLNGFRIELGEIEGKALMYEGVRQVCAQVRNSQICLYYTVNKEVDKIQLKEYLSTTIAEYMVPSVYMELEAMPLNPNGKIDRKALPDPVIAEEEIVAPANEVEEKLLEIAKSIITGREFGVTNNIISLGMSSLAVMRFNAAIHKQLDMKLRISDIMKNPAIRNIVGLFASGKIEATEIKHYDTREYYPLTENQRGIYIDWEMNRNSTQYNIPRVIVFTDKNAEMLAEAIKTAVHVHSPLKTRLVQLDDDVMQQSRINDDVEVAIINCNSEPDGEFFRARVRPFDLLNEKLYRFEIYKHDGKIYFFMDVHHIIFDGLSRRVLLRDIMSAYEGEVIEEEAITAYDVSIYEQEIISSDKYSTIENYYDDMASNAEAAAYPSSSVADGNKNGCVVANISTENINKACADFGITVNAYFQAVISEVILRISRLEKPMYLTISNGRSADYELNNAVGMFVKTLPVVVNSSQKHGQEKIEVFCKNVYDQLQKTYDYEVYPYTKFIEKYQLRGEILFAYQGGLENVLIDKDMEAFTDEISLDTAKLPILIMVFPTDNQYMIRLEYDGCRYNKADMTILLNTISNVAEAFSKAETIGDVELISQSECQELIELGTGPVMERDSSETILSIFNKRAEETPNATAVVFGDKKFTYAELDEISDRLAVYLNKNYDINTGDNVGVMINRSELMLIYPLAIMKNGAAYMPLDPHFPTDRLSFMCDDASVKVILSEGSLLEEKLPEFAGSSFNSSELNNVPDVSKEEIESLNYPEANDCMVILFTSGSTGVPKAVELEQHSIANFAHWYVKEFELTAEDKVSAYANFGFDAHMMDIYPAILAGAAIYILPDDMRKDLQLVNEYMEKVGITVSFFTTQVGCLIKDMNGTLRLMSVGGEKLPLTTAPAYRFVNGYGPTECSIYTATCDVEGTDDGTYIGRPIANYQVYVIDANCQLVPRGVPGELLICGEGVARGYMNRPELTAEKFIMFKPTEDSEPIRGYRSGDLVRWAENDKIQYLGRIDKQVKLRGLRIELGEIENRAASYAGIKQVAVDVKNDQLCCYYVAEAEIDKNNLKAHLAETLTEFMVPEVYMELAVMPLNANGKIDRRALPEPEAEIGEIVAPANETEEKLLNIAFRVLKKKGFGVTNNLVSVGMSSLAAMRLATAVYKDTNKQIRVSDIMKNPTVRGIAGLFVDEKNENTGIKIYGARDYYPLTENQRGIYIDWEMNRETTQYNIPSVYKFTDKTAERLVKAVKVAINAHGVLKTRFVFVGEEVMQQPHWDEAPEVALIELTEEPNTEFFQSRVRPFDLFSDRLYRIEIYSYNEAVYLFVDIHHNFYDGMSTGVFMNDVLLAYADKEVTPEEITAYDFAIHENELIGSAEYAEAESYYDNLVSDATAVSYADSTNPDGEKSPAVIVEIPAEEIDRICAENGITVSSYLNAAFAETIQRITREENPMYLTISNGREADARLSKCVGMFVKTLPVVFKTEKHTKESVADYIKSFHTQLQNTIANDFYPYTNLVEKYKLKGEMMFVYQGGVSEGVSIDGAKCISLELDTVKLPIVVTAYPHDGKYVINIGYDGKRYGKQDIELLGNSIRNIAVTMAKAEKISEASIVSEDEKAEIIRLSAGKRLDYNTAETWVDLFKAQVSAHGESLAVVDSVSSLTYAELDKQSDKIASYLVNNGVKANDFVAVKMGRVKEFVIAVLGINKAGAAYIPVDPEYPEDRIQYMIDDSEAKAVMTEELISEALNTETTGFINLTAPENLAYMIYTSGSTGKPKGAMIYQKGFRNFVEWNNKEFGHSFGTNHLVHASFSFDASIFDMLCPLAAGSTVHIANDEMRHDLTIMANYLNEKNITGMLVTTQIGMALLNGYDTSLKYLALGGEKMLPVKKSGVQVYNAYGPTEFTAASSFYPVSGDETEIPIGRPVPNTYSFVCDTAGNLVPMGVAGELCLAGRQVGAGYWKQPEKTKEVFVDCPFIPGEKMYRTGDLVRYNQDGNLEYMGRIDFQVKLRGFRIELGEIENRASAYDGIGQVIAQVKKNTLVLYFTGDSAVDTGMLRDFMAETLTEYMVPSVYMQMEKMPMTPGGKIDRKALPEPQMASSAEYVAPETEAEIALAESMQRVLGIKEQIGALDNFFELGGDSIKAIRIVSLLRQKDINLKVADMMKLKVIREIAKAAKVAQEAMTISQAPFAGEIDNSAIIEYFNYLDLPIKNHFNQSAIYKLRKSANVDILQLALNDVTYQHDLLRGRVKNGKLFVCGAEKIIAIQVFDNINSTEEITEICRDIQTGISMDEQLFYAALFHCGGTDYLAFVAHHLIIDGVSWRIIGSDLEQAYANRMNGKAADLPLKTHTYNDYVEALKRFRNSYKLELETPYWDEVQAKLMKYTTSEERDYSRNISEMDVSLNKEDTERLTRANYGVLNADINDALLTAVCRSYRNITGENSVSVQLEGHGREDIGEELVIDRTIGWFTSIYPVVVDNLTGDIHQDIINVKETLHRVPNKGVGYNVLRFIHGNAENKTDYASGMIPRISFNYLGDMGSEQQSDSMFITANNISTGGSVAAANNFGADININCLIAGGQFTLTLTYNNATMDGMKAKAFSEGILKEIRDISAYLEQCKLQEFTATDLGENIWSVEEFNNVVAEYASRNEKITRIYPLTAMQEGMLLTHVSNPQDWAYRLVAIYEIDKLPTEVQLNNVLARLSKKHEVLRTAIIHEGVEQPRQAIIDRRLTVNMMDYTQIDNQEEAVYKYREEVLTNAYDLQRKPLFQLTCIKKSENSCYLVVANHHAIVDGWCLGIYTNDLFRFIAEEITDNITTDEASADGLYETAVREILNKDKRAGLKYWKTLLDGYDTRAEIPSYGDIPEAEQSAVDSVLGIVNKDLTDKFIDLCNKEQATISNGAELVWGLILQTYSRTQDAVFVKVVSGRDNTEVDVNNLVGLFINSVPVRVKADKDSTSRQLLRSLQQQSAESNEYDFCPLSEILQQSELGSQLFQSVLAFENYNSGNEQAENKSSIAINVKTLLIKEEKFDDITPSLYINNGQLCLRITYNKAHYRQADIQKVVDLFKLLVAGIVNNPDMPINELPRVAEADKQELMLLGSGPVLDRDSSETILSIFNKRAEETPNATAVVFGDKKFTYAELDEISDRLAVYLNKNYDINTGDNVGVMINRSELMLIYPLAIMKNGAAYMPLDPHFPTERLAFMCDDASVKVILSERRLLEEKLPEFAGQSFNSRGLAELPNVTAEELNNLNMPKPDDAMVILFTSGSTGVPKAVELEQHSIANFAHWYVKDFELTADDKVSAYANFGFDAHMMDIYPAILAGAAIYILPDDMRKDLQLVNEYMEKVGITVSFFTTQVGCLIKDMNRTLRLMSVGGEKLPLTTAPAYRFVNGYGPTECSIYTATCDVEGTDDGTYIGRPIANYQVYVVDANCQLVPRGVPGELLICGEGVARGYMNRPELTAEKFIMFKPTADSEPIRGYRSGDLVRWAENDKIQYLGRIDKQVKLRGLRIELGEIENRAASYAGIKQVAVDVKNDQLCCYYVAEAEIDKNNLKAHLAETLTEFMVPEVYMELAVMPLNANGKIDRRALPEPEAEIGEIIAPANEMEEKLLNIAFRVLKKKGFGVTNNLVSVGMSSLAAMRLSSAIFAELSKKVRVADIMKNPTIRGIASMFGEKVSEKKKDVLEDVYNLLRIYRSGKTEAADILDQMQHILADYGKGKEDILLHYPLQKYYPLTENQRGIYIDWEMNRDTTQYNIPAVYKFTDKNPEKLAEAIKAAINAHGVLKTRFAFVGEEVMQQPHLDELPEVLVTTANEKPTSEFFQSRVKPFDLFNDKLYRIEIYSYNKEVYLFMDIHHNLYDGMSTSVFKNDILAAYAGRNLREEEITAYDFAVYERELINSDKYANAEGYYDSLLSGATAVTYAGSDSPDGSTATPIDIEISAKEIDRTCAKYGVTVSSYLNAAFAETIYRITREENPMYLTISNGREADTRLCDCVGMFVKTLPVVLKTENHGRELVADYIKSFHAQLQDTISNDFYSYTNIVEKHQIKGEMIFVYQGGLSEENSLETEDSISLTLDTVKLPISVMAYQSKDGYRLSIEYDGSRYSKEDMLVLGNSIKSVAISMTTADKVSDIKLLDKDEEQRVIELSKGIEIPYDNTKTWIDVITSHEKMQPDHVAVVDNRSRYTYGELGDASNKIASYLVANGVAVNDFVAVKMGRVKEFVATIIGIQKAGAAYVPIDPDYPAERISYMVENSEAKFVLTEEKVSEILASDIEIKNINFAKPENLAYMIYTSGSTGKPKGVMQSHRSLRAFTMWRTSVLDVNPQKRHSQYTSFSFDASLDDLISPLAGGAEVHIISDELRKDMDGFKQYIINNKITNLTLPIQMGMTMLSQHADMPVESIMMGGEKMLPCQKTDIKLINCYGPTEFTVCSSFHVVNQEVDNDIPIGRPVPNTYSFICDSTGNLLPNGLVGELCLLGPQLGNGYWRLPEKTSEVFVNCPFMPGMKMYRTGDLARYNKNGELEYLGRIDFQVKLRGFRIELGEIENRAVLYTNIKQVIAQVKKNQLVLYYTAEDDVDKGALKVFMAEALTEYMVPTVYIQLDKMPMTPNGKIDRKALPEPQMASSVEYVAPKTDVERALVESMQKILGVKDQIGVLDNFFELGGDSIKAIRVVSLLRQKDINLKVADMMKLKVIREIAKAAKAAQNTMSISQEPFTGEVRNSAIIEFFNNLNLPEPHHFNQSFLFKVKGDVDMAVLQKALDVVVSQHDLLRARVKDGKLYVDSTDKKISIREYDHRR